MSIFTKRRLTMVAGASAAVMYAAATAVAAPGGAPGPSSTDSPYLVRSVPGVTLTSLLTAGDSVGGYRMAGTPDGLGAFDNGDGTFTVLMNHEFGAGTSVPRSHGNTSGSFVSRWVIDKDTLEVLSGRDQITNLITTGSKNIDRLCSADLPAVTAFYNPATGLGYNGRIFTNGEESAPNGRAFANVVETGDSYELPALGKAGWENVAANPATGNRTVVVGQSDGGTQNVYVYAGDKQSAGTPVDKAGLTNGVRKVVNVAGYPVESGGTAFPSTPQPFTLSDTGTTFDRPEDGAWDPNSPNDYYFVTTASMSKHSRLWKLSFKDASKPELGGTVTKVLEGPADDSSGSVGPKMMDNITINDRGQVLIQEDPGGNAYLAGVYQYDISSGAVRRIADHDPQRFTTGGSYFDTIDEESSGIIPVPFLGKGQYLLDDQNHTKVTDAAQVEKGQLLLMHVPPGQPVGKDNK
ncbi:MAG: large protein [Nocardioides sp.]|nr:large protein [Nocardioides sp.]